MEAKDDALSDVWVADDGLNVSVGDDGCNVPVVDDGQAALIQKN